MDDGLHAIERRVHDSSVYLHGIGKTRVFIDPFLISHTYIYFRGVHRAG